MSTHRAVVLVEGESDRAAVLTLARRHGRDLHREGIEVVAMGGITNTRAFALRYGPHGLGVPLAGLYDAADEDKLLRGLAAADADPTAFFSCVADLEDELIRALGVDAVEAVIAEAAELRSLRLLAQMPAQHGWTRVQLLRRFIGSRSGRKAKYAALLTEALEPGREPEPLSALLGTLEACAATSDR